MLLCWKYYEARERKIKFLGSTLVDSRAIPRCCEMILAQMSGLLPSIAQIQQHEMQSRLQKKKKRSVKKDINNDNDMNSDSNEEKEGNKSGSKKKGNTNDDGNNDNEEEEKAREDKDDDDNEEDDEHNMDSDLRFHVANEMNDNWEFYE